MLPKICYISFLITFLSFLAFGQSRIFKPWVLKGQALNHSDSTFRFNFIGVVNDRFDSVKISKDGFFEVSEDLLGQSEIIFSIKGELHALYCVPGETVSISYDSVNMKLINLRGPSPSATDRLNYEYWNLFKAGKRRDSIFRNVIFKTRSQKAKYELIDNYYRDDIAGIKKDKNILSKESKKYIVELYFQYLRYMSLDQLYDYEKLAVSKAFTKNIKIGWLPDSLYYKAISSQLVLLSPQYRSFFFDYLRRLTYDKDTNILNGFFNPKDKTFDMQKANARMEYSRADLITNQFVKEWFMARCILFSLHSYDMSETQKIIKEYLTSLHPTCFKVAVKNAGLLNKKFEKGEVAPDFRLLTDSGKVITLANLRGQYVLINFWGVHCAPCIVEMKNSYPELINKYKNSRLTILNICTDETEENWKHALLKYKFGGVNCLSNFESDMVYDYAITSTPHYLIIDPMGKIYSYNASIPETYIGMGTEIDKLLEEIK
jgi:peroxiredoxin